MKLPQKFEQIIAQNQSLHSVVLDIISSFEPILNDNKLYFFEEYTDHGISHIEKVLESAEFIISEDSFNNITPHEIAVLILSVILHDIGMHVGLSTFNLMLNGAYDPIKNEILDDKTWRELWDDYLAEVKRFSTAQKKDIFGDEEIPFVIPNLSNKDRLTGYDKKMIGEFIRRFHGRIAQEVCLNGLHGADGIVDFGTEKLNLPTRQLIGILARSHSMNIRDTFSYLQDIAHDSWRNPHEINIIYLMVVLRIADYIQIDKERANPYLLKLKSFNSPISHSEHQTHLAIISLNFNTLDNENIYVDCNPTDSKMFVKISKLITDIQNEFDKSWAILGEIYGFIPNNRPAIRFRRIASNLENKAFLIKLNYLPEKVTFKVDNHLSKLLVAPLYGDNPTFGVRELLQNSIDACAERKEIEYQKENFNYVPEIEVKIERINDQESRFSITDNGKGMSSSEVVNYFLNVGSSFRKSMDWKKRFIDDEGRSKINRNGKFGIGVLASFLLGKEIEVRTKNITSNESLSFTASIDSQFINVARAASVNGYGTRISIVINNEIRNKLINPERKWNDKSIEWMNWYIYTEPRIKYSVDTVSIQPRDWIKDIIFYEFSSENFEKIFWSYSVRGRDGYSTSMVVCNGIIITEDYQSSVFSYPELNHYSSPEYKRTPTLISDKPSLLIVDKEGIFPVKLDRNDIDCDEFPFEKELLIEASKHFLAQVLSAEISANRFKNPSIIHTPNLIYGTDGFIIDTKYFIDGVKNDYRFIRILVEGSYIDLDISKYRSCFFDFKLGTKLNLTYQQPNVAPAGGGLILLSKSKFDALFRSTGTKRLNKYVTKGVRIVEEDDDYVLYNIFNFTGTAVILGSLKSIDPNLVNKVSSVQEITSTIFDTQEGNILNGLFRKYIKNKYVIPYDIEKRKEMYQEAFKELAQYIDN